MNFGDWAGKLKVWQGRLGSYISMVNFVMIFYLYILESPMGLLWYHWFLLIMVICSVVIFIDVRFIYPGALSYTFDKNPPMLKMKRDIEEIKELLKEK